MDDTVAATMLRTSFLSFTQVVLALIYVDSGREIREKKSYTFFGSMACFESTGPIWEIPD